MNTNVITCVRLSCRLTATACAKRYAETVGARAVCNGGTNADGQFASCKGCPIGAANLAAEPSVIVKSAGRYRAYQKAVV